MHTDIRQRQGQGRQKPTDNFISHETDRGDSKKPRQAAAIKIGTWTKQINRQSGRERQRERECV